MQTSWKFRWTFWPGNYIWSLSLWIWTQMRHLGTLIPRFCTEFRYLSYGQSGLAWGAIFEKVPKYQETPSFFKICMSIFPGTGSQNEFFPYVPPAAFSNGELEGRSPLKMQGGSGVGAAPPRMLCLYSYFILQYFQIHRLYQNGWSFSISRKAGYIRMVGPSVFPEKQVIPKWLDFQYFQIHGSKNQVLRLKIYFLGLISSPKRLLNIFQTFPEYSPPISHI